MTKEELRDLIFGYLYQQFQGAEDVTEPQQFVGVQGDDAIIVMQKGGEHLGVRVVDAVLG